MGRKKMLPLYPVKLAPCDVTKSRVPSAPELEKELLVFGSMSLLLSDFCVTHFSSFGPQHTRGFVGSRAHQS
jgi:hypothetical protein